MLGHFGPCWHHIGSCWAMLGYFRICVGLCFGLGHFNVVEFSSMPGVCKKHQKYQEKIQFVDCVADGFCCYFLFVFVSFLGHAAVRLCLPDLGLMLGHCGLCRHHIGLMLGHFGVFCGLRLPLLSHFRGILWFTLAWQAWHFVTSTFVFVAGDICLRFAWQVWHLVTLTFHLHGRRGTCGTGLAVGHFVTHLL